MKRHYWPLFQIWIGFIVISLLLVLIQTGIRYDANAAYTAILPADEIVNVKKSPVSKDTLLLYDSKDENALLMKDQYDAVFKDMRVGYETRDIDAEDVPSLSSYRRLVVLVSDFGRIGRDVLTIAEWVRQGGYMLLGMPSGKCGAFDVVAGRMGIDDDSYDFTAADSFKTTDGFMLGDGRSYAIEDPYESSMMVSLSEDTKVYASTADGKVPLIFSHAYGKGKFVVNNFGYVSKEYRGIYASAFSLLDDICIWPVINGSTFYLDDFPSPVPSGDSEYIERDYNMTTAEFYADVWWPDVLSLGRKHNITYTGMLIETYEDQTSGRLRRNISTSNYFYYGNMLLNQGGEIGIHGYNHQPFALKGYVYKSDDYALWDSRQEMEYALQEVIDFAHSLYPSAVISVYVPPSNILTGEGREMIGSDFKDDIKAIASIYLPGDDVYEQEFTVSEDGIVEMPRIVSGNMTETYTRITAFSELNFHYVNCHFMHPDDLLDTDRGAEEGWEAYKTSLDDYMTWLDQSAPDIRHMTASALAGAVQRFVSVTPEISRNENQLHIHLDGFQDEAWFLLRINDGTYTCTGGEMTRLNDTLYLLHAEKEDLVLSRDAQ